MSEFTFSDAELPWLPTLGDVEYFKVNSEDPDYWKKFGWEALEVPGDAPLVGERMDQLKIRFNERYFNRMLNAETMERWQSRLQNRFDEIVMRYNRLYELYARYDEEMKNDIIEGEKTVTRGTVSSGGADSTTGRNIDTPDEQINDVSGYAGSRSTSEINYGRTDTTDVTVDRTLTGMRIVDSINSSTANWLDIDTEFVKDFENLFLNVLWC